MQAPRKGKGRGEDKGTGGSRRNKEANKEMVRLWAGGIIRTKLKSENKRSDGEGGEEVKAI